MELAHTPTWEGITIGTPYGALRDKIREKTRQEPKKQKYSYKGTTRIKERETGYHEFENFTL